MSRGVQVQCCEDLTSWKCKRVLAAWQEPTGSAPSVPLRVLSFSSGANHPLGPPSRPLSTSSSCVSTLRCTVRGTRTFWYRLHGRLSPLRFLRASVWRLAALSLKSREKQMERRAEREQTPPTYCTHSSGFPSSCAATPNTNTLSAGVLGVVKTIVALSPSIIHLCWTVCEQGGTVEPSHQWQNCSGQNTQTFQ